MFELLCIKSQLVKLTSLYRYNLNWMNEPIFIGTFLLNTTKINFIDFNLGSDKILNNLHNAKYYMYLGSIL